MLFLAVPSPKIVINFPGPMRSYPVKENSFGLVTDRQTNIQTTFYFIFKHYN